MVRNMNGHHPTTTRTTAVLLHHFFQCNPCGSGRTTNSLKGGGKEDIQRHHHPQHHQHQHQQPLGEGQVGDSLWLVDAQKRQRQPLLKILRQSSSSSRGKRQRPLRFFETSLTSSSSFGWFFLPKTTRTTTSKTARSRFLLFTAIVIMLTSMIRPVQSWMSAVPSFTKTRITATTVRTECMSCSMLLGEMQRNKPQQRQRRTVSFFCSISSSPPTSFSSLTTTRLSATKLQSTPSSSASSSSFSSSSSSSSFSQIPNENKPAAKNDDNDDDDESTTTTTRTTNWRDHPAVNPIIVFPTLVVPSQQVHALIQEERMQPYLASRLPVLQHLHKRLKIVRDNNNNNSDNDSDTITNTNKKQKSNKNDEKSSKKKGKSSTTTTKLLLLHPDVELPSDVKEWLFRQTEQKEVEETEQGGGAVGTITMGPSVTVSFVYHEFTASYLVSQLLPPHLLPVPLSFETVGHIAHLNGLLDHGQQQQQQEIWNNYRHLIGQILLETLQPRIQTVIHKIGHVQGDFRTFEYEVLATATTETATLSAAAGAVKADTKRNGHTTTATAASSTTTTNVDAADAVDTNSTTTTTTTTPLTQVKLVEHGVSLEFDFSKVYWCSRLEFERQRLIQAELLHSQAVPVGAATAPKQLKENQGKQKENAEKKKKQQQVILVADPFCGVGAILLQLAKQAKTQEGGKTTVSILANDWNPHAIESLRKNIVKNKVEDAFLNIQSGDAYDFLMDLGLQQQEREQQQQPTSLLTETEQGEMKKSTSKAELSANCDRRLPDHVVMNFPLEAPRFLGALRWWPTSSSSSLERRRGAKKKSIRSRLKQAANQFKRTTNNKESAKNNNESRGESVYDVDVDDDNQKTNTENLNDDDDDDDDGYNNHDDVVIIPRVHVYTFARAHPETNRSMAEVAVDLVAYHLLPDMTPQQQQQQQQRQQQPQKEEQLQSTTPAVDEEFLGAGLGARLDSEYGCNINCHAVRDVAPSKHVFCISFSATPKLLRHMQGDFRD